MYKQSKLNNGLRVITRTEKLRNSVAFGFWVGVGGRYEDDRVKGAAHFLEHIVFKGSKNYTCQKIKEAVEGVGGTLNAFTSEEQTCYYAKVPAFHFESAFDALADMVFFPKIPEREVQKEKGVIVEEIKMYHDLPQYHVMELLDQLVWPDHPLGKSLAGTIDSVNGMSKADLKGFHKKNYSPNNVVVSACGKIDHKRLTRLVTAKLNTVKSFNPADYIRYEGEQVKPRTHFEARPIEQMHVALGMTGFNENDPRRYVLALINIILGGNMSSRLFVEVREKRGLAYSISSASRAKHDTGLFIIRAGVDSTKIVDAIDVVLKELDKIANKLVPEAEFKRAKDYLSGQLLLGLEDTMEHMLWMGESLVARNKVQTLDQVVKTIDSITREELKKIAKHVFKRNKYNIAVIGPLTPAHKKSIKQLLA